MLRRLESLDAEVLGRPLPEVLAAAYPHLVVPGD
ncbi:hypothetical protein BH23ACT2_BH23ACT2_05390 [soil metagenome]